MTLLFSSPYLWAQYKVKGSIASNGGGNPLSEVAVNIEGAPNYQTFTGSRGDFIMELTTQGSYKFVFALQGYTSVVIEKEIKDPETDLGVIELVSQQESVNQALEDFIPTVTLTEDEFEQGSESQNVSGVLAASRDAFISAAAFTFGPMRFRIRGYDAGFTEVLFNGVPVNDLEDGFVSWNDWGGLNDVTRYRETDLGLAVAPYAFGGVGGASNFDTRASLQRKQLRLTYSLSNRSYRNRLMATWSTGLLEKGWAITLSGSRRWAEEGYIQGTFYDAWAYFASVDKKVGNKHQFNLTVLGAPLRRGRSTGASLETYEFAGDNFYNPYWGYQNGEKRSSSEAHGHEPLAILRHDWNIKPGVVLTNAVSYQTGISGVTGLDWFDAPDPRPDYYRKMPSYLTQVSPELANDQTQFLQTHKEALQLNWQELYDVNRNSLLHDKYAYLFNGQATPGKWSQYILEDRLTNTKTFNWYSSFQHSFSDAFTTYMGMGYQSQTSRNYKEIADLLGGDYYVNVDKYALRDSLANRDFQRNNLQNDELVVEEGDTWGYDYEGHSQRAQAWLQGQWTSKFLEAFLGFKVVNSSFWRTGNYRTGKFPETSFGDSEKQSFFDYAFKAGITYKLSGRHYLFANAAYITQAPFFENAYASPRTRDQLIPDLKSQSITSFEGGYYLRSPNVKGRAVAYLTQFKDQVDILQFYNDLQRAFGSYVINDLNTRHEGVELALEAKVTAAFSVSGVAAIGRHYYTSRGVANVFQDNASALSKDLENFTVYSKNYYLSNGPQAAYTFGMRYNSRHFWFATLNANYFDNMYVSFSPVRRTADAVYNLDNDPEKLAAVVGQERLPGQFTLDLFAGKSFKFGDNFLYLNLGVSNLLNNKDFRTGGYEQLRFDTRERDLNLYPNKYFYAYGLNYFFNVSWRF